MHYCAIRIRACADESISVIGKVRHEELGSLSIHEHERRTPGGVFE